MEMPAAGHVHLRKKAFVAELTYIWEEISSVELHAIPTGQTVGALCGLHCCVYVNLNDIVDVCHAAIPITLISQSPNCQSFPLFVLSVGSMGEIYKSTNERWARSCGCQTLPALLFLKHSGVKKSESTCENASIVYLLFNYIISIAI